MSQNYHFRNKLVTPGAFSNQNLTCSFTRENTLSTVSPYYSLSNGTTPYFLVAFGKESRTEMANDRRKASDQTNLFSYSSKSSLIEANKSLFVLVISFLLITFNI